MLLSYDTEADAIYVSLREHEGALRSRNADDWRRVVDYDEVGEAVGIELLAVSAGLDLDGLPRADEISAAIRSFPRLEGRS